MFEITKRFMGLRALNQRHMGYIRAELSGVQGLIPLLMKRRNGGQWTAEERGLLLRDLRALSGLSPYLIPLLMPGGILLLPLVAYWMDRRRNRRSDGANGEGHL
ncbi:MAG: hypothetical protein PHF75_08110 [Gallionella sp.]|nr:hypothetical protein [Gallionella sp.]